MHRGGALSPDLLALLKEHRAELLTALRRNDPGVLPLSTPNGPCTVTIPRDQYDPEAFEAFTDRLALIPPATETDPQRWRSAELTAPDMRAITITTLDGWGQAWWRSLALAYFPTGPVVHPLDPVEMEGGA